MAPFMPVAERARWRVIYDLAQPMAIGEVLTYKAMASALEMHPVKDRHVLQMAARRALRELLHVDHRAADSVKNVGYRIAAPVEHVDLAQRRNRRAGRQIAAGTAIATKVDLTGVDPTTVDALAAIARGFAMQAEINRRIAAKQVEHESLIDMLTERVERLEKGGPTSPPA